MGRYRFQFLFLFLICYGTVVWGLISSWGNTLAVGGAPSAAPVVIVDPGHGRFDGGAEGPGGTVEKDINLPIALKVRDLLTLYGFDVIMTRQTDTATCDDGLEGISAKKTSDILNRFKLIEQHPEAIFLSIHQNKYPDSTSHGAQMFYGPKSEQSQPLAEILQQNFISMLQPDNTRAIKPAEESVYLMVHSPVPSVLVECGFLSNPEDERLLSSEEYQNKIAFIVASSLLEYRQQPATPPAEESGAGAPQTNGEEEQ